MEFKDEATFLGMTFDHKLTWRKHIDKLISKCQKDLNVMRAVSGTSFGADKLTLKNLYNALILSKIEYGLQAYASASKTQLARLDVRRMQPTPTQTKTRRNHIKILGKVISTEGKTTCKQHDRIQNSTRL